jgi:hypothetical protein
MHVVAPFAAPLSEAALRAWHALELPNLDALLPRLGRVSIDDGDEYSLTPPHERALARALGMSGTDGCLPWAAQAAADADIDTAGLAWGLLTPVHLHLGSEQVTMLDPALLRLDAGTSRALFDAVGDLYTSEGCRLHWLAPTAWLVAHDSLRALPTASIDRVIGRNVDRWLPAAAAARLMRRLQNETQMLLHTHALNAQREAAGLPTVNSVWLSGCGAWQPASRAPRDLVVEPGLRAPALAEDWAAWAEAWRAFDAGALARLLEAARAGADVSLTLCGERRARRFEAAPRSLWQRLAGAAHGRRADALAAL